MDNLKSLMTSLDDISKLIPEGTYLEMCDNLKMVHDQIPRNNDPPVRDNRRLPFQVIQRGDNVESEPNHDIILEDPDWCVEMDQNEEIIRKLLADMKIADRSLRILKPIQHITKKVREDALMSYCRQANFYPMEMTEWTFEKFVEIATRHNWPESHRNKRYERKIHENYKIIENRRIERLISESGELKRNLEREISGYRDRQNYLRFTYYNL
jgi:hypothetical protein|tara:strand:- start:2567 stop:3202 length:636 start_codon:yes stop_codon:yes gene_type:complete